LAIAIGAIARTFGDRCLRVWRQLLDRGFCKQAAAPIDPIQQLLDEIDECSRNEGSVQELWRMISSDRERQTSEEVSWSAVGSPVRLLDHTGCFGGDDESSRSPSADAPVPIRPTGLRSGL
jgi:hypothetical protein